MEPHARGLFQRDDHGDRLRSLWLSKHPGTTRHGKAAALSLVAPWRRDFFQPALMGRRAKIAGTVAKEKASVGHQKGGLSRVYRQKCFT